jgi:hypothetical protein
MALCFFVISKEGIEISAFDIIESKDKKGTILDRVISPTPEITKDFNGTYDESGEPEVSLFIMGGNPLLNPFEEDVQKIFRGSPYERYFEGSDSFDNDFNIFNEKSDFIKERDLQLESESK